MSVLYFRHNFFIIIWIEEVDLGQFPVATACLNDQEAFVGDLLDFEVVCRTALINDQTGILRDLDSMRMYISTAHKMILEVVAEAECAVLVVEVELRMLAAGDISSQMSLHP